MYYHNHNGKYFKKFSQLKHTYWVHEIYCYKLTATTTTSLDENGEYVATEQITKTSSLQSYSYQYSTSMATSSDGRTATAVPGKLRGFTDEKVVLFKPMHIN